MDRNIHQRVLELWDAALGSRKSVTVNSALASASYDCAVDSLLALHTECNQGSLAKDKNIARFLHKYEATVSSLKNLRLTANDFEVKSIIGRGHFGEVQVVSEKSTGDVYAMKVMKKTHILQQPDAAFFSEERDIMAWTVSPWLTSLHYAFQDPQNLYLVMDFHPGGDLLTVMERHEGGMSEDEARFYLAEIAVALNDLHRLGFVHRDVKPDNVLITRSGHIKLVDFGSAARLDAGGKVLESRLPVGTPEYIAPEVLTSLDSTADYGVCCDWWSLGIIAYELLFEVTPFEGESTTQTYSNIMNFKKSLNFPGDIVASEEVKSLIRQLLTGRNSRTEFEGIKGHVFFTATNWDNLLSVLPPYIPSVTGPDDTSNFDVFEPTKEDRFPDLPSKDRKGFLGKSLPFIGFTFTRYNSTPDIEFSDSHSGAEGHFNVSAMGVQKLQTDLEQTQRELREMKDRKMSLERECVIYQSQLEDFHRKLEIEKLERRNSDSKALQLLEEVREQGRIAHELRENETKLTEEEVSSVVEQLEKDRIVASKRAKRLQEDLKQTQQDHAAALRQVSELKAKLAEVKKSTRKDITALQAKLTKVTKDSLAKSADMQDRLTEAHERFAETSKKLKAAETARRKLEFELKKVQLQSVADNASNEDAEKLETSRLTFDSAECSVSKLEERLGAQSRENQALQTQNSDLRSMVKDLEGQLEEASAQSQKLETSECSLNKELQELRLEVDQLRQNQEQLVTNCKKTQSDLRSKTQLIRNHEETISKLTSARNLLETKLAELERLREAAENRTSTDESIKVLGKQVDQLEVEKHHLSQEVSSLQAQLETKSIALEETKAQVEVLRKKEKEGDSRLRDEVRSLQGKLSEVTNMAIQQGEKMREVRRAKREIDQENTTLRSTLTKAESVARSYEERYKEVTEELKALNGVKQKLSSLEEEIKSLLKANKDMHHEMEGTQQAREELLAAKREAEAVLRDTRKQMEAQELSIALLQRNVKSLEDELVDARAAAEESRAQEAQWRAIKETVEGDLEMAEGRLDSAFAAVEKEKNLRLAADQHMTEALCNLEKTAAAHSEEIQCLQLQLDTQKQLASKYSDKVSELEKDVKLKQLSLKDIQKQLETEKALSSKLYDDLHNMGREHGKLKASHLKLLKESQQQEMQLAQVSEAREKVLVEQQSTVEAHHLQETRLQATIAQQSKLIDYLQGTPKSKLKIKKGFKLTRKSRDPAKEIAEWNKLKGLVSKPKGVSGIVAQSSTPSISLHRVTRASSRQSITSSASQQSITSSGGLSTCSFGSQKTSNSSSSSSTTSGGVGSLSPHSMLVVIPSLTTTTTTIPLTPVMQSYVNTVSSKSAAPSTVPASATSAPSSGSDSFPGVTQYFSVTTLDEEKPQILTPIPITSAGVSGPSSSDSSTRAGVKEFSVQVVKNVSANISPPKIAGRKRSHDEVTLATSLSAAGGGIGSGVVKMEHNIPHKFFLKSAPLRKSYSCAVCEVGIKHLEKLAKCRYCAIVCHPTCIDSLPNNCGLPPELATHVHSDQPLSAKKPRMVAERETDSEAHEATSSGKQSSSESENKIEGKGIGKKGKKMKKGKTIKTEKVYVPKGDFNSEGWLVLTENSLCLYDREPKRTTRKPINTFKFDSPELAFVVLSSVEQRLLPYASPSKQLPLAFGIQQLSSSNTEHAAFVVSSIQSKIEWVEAIERVLSKCSQMVKPQARELKSVSVIPIKTTRQSTGSSGKGEEILNFSITSSMLESPTSVSDV